VITSSSNPLARRDRNIIIHVVSNDRGVGCAEIFRFQPHPAMMLEYVMRWKRPYPYENDPTVRLGQMIGDALFAILVIFMVWGLFIPLLQRVL
jgi:hypothetical protein